MTQHTNGPWRKDEVIHHKADGSTELISSTVYAGKTRIAVVDDERDQDLIAAAPDMLAALKRLTDYSRRPTQADWQAADAAIAKAEGSLT